MLKHHESRFNSRSDEVNKSSSTAIKLKTSLQDGPTSAFSAVRKNVLNVSLVQNGIFCEFSSLSAVLI